MSWKLLVTRWGLLVGLLLLAAGAGLLVIDPAVYGEVTADVGKIAGAAFFGLAALTFVSMFVVWLRKKAASRKLTAYGCPKCGYAPNLKDIQRGRSFPCPACGQPIYRKV